MNGSVTEPSQCPEPEFLAPLILESYANMHVLKKCTDQREFNQNMCRWFLKDKIKILKSFCSNLIKIRAFLLVLNMDVCVTLPVLRNWERGLWKRVLCFWYRCLMYSVHLVHLLNMSTVDRKRFPQRLYACWTNDETSFTRALREMFWRRKKIFCNLRGFFNYNRPWV